jgi:nucleotide-binding universal stress UspA family protein
MTTLPAPETVLLCTDGSDLALSALQQGLALLRPPERIVLLTVAPPVDPTLVTGTGFAGGVMTFDEKNELIDAQRANAQQVLDEVAAALGLGPGTNSPDGPSTVEAMVDFGDAGHVICEHAATLPASVVVLGTHGHSGIRRAIMGSTSDYVVRHAVCPVLVQGGG